MECMLIFEFWKHSTNLLKDLRSATKKPNTFKSLFKDYQGFGLQKYWTNKTLFDIYISNISHMRVNIISILNKCTHGTGVKKNVIILHETVYISTWNAQWCHLVGMHYMQSFWPHCEISHLLNCCDTAVQATGNNSRETKWADVHSINIGIRNKNLTNHFQFEIFKQNIL